MKRLGKNVTFTPDFTATVSTDARYLEWTADTYLVLRYLTQELEKCSLVSIALLSSNIIQNGIQSVNCQEYFEPWSGGMGTSGNTQ